MLLMVKPPSLCVGTDCSYMLANIKTTKNLCESTLHSYMSVINVIFLPYSAQKYPIANFRIILSKLWLLYIISYQSLEVAISIVPAYYTTLIKN